MIPIPYARTYTVTAKGQTPKLVKCEACGLDYVYILRVTSQAEDTSWLFLDNQGAQDRARLEAEHRLQGRLAADCAVVPCPGCGRVQDHMLPKARRQHLRWMKLVALICAAAGGILVALAALYWLIESGTTSKVDAGTIGLLSGAGALLLLAPVLAIGRLVRCRSYDPNHNPAEARIKEGKELAMTSEEFRKMLEETTD